MEQPIQPDNYEKPEQLIKWLKQDLEYQRSIGVAEDELILNIGKKTNKQNKTNAIEFSLGYDFNLKGILSDLGDVLDDDIHNGNRICRYIVNLNKINSSKTGPIIDFSNTTFNNEIYASSSIFNLDVNFSNSIFIKEVNFNACNFMGVTYFKDSHFYKDAYFTSTFFNKMASFVGIKTRSKVTFDNLSFGKGTCIMFFRDIYCNEDECFTNSEIEIKNSVIDCRIDFNNVHISKFRFKNASVISGGVISRVDFEPYIENPDTAIIFKHEELARSNTIKALKYKAIEKDRYYDEIKKGIITKFLNIFKTKNKKIENKKADQNIRELFAELTSLWLSKSSNNHGQNWFLAVAFIIAVSFIFLSLASFALMSISWFYSFLLFYLLSLLLSIYINNHLVNIVSTVIISVIIYIIFSTSFPLETVVINTDKINVMNLFITGYVNYLTPTNLDLINGVAHCIDNASSNKYLLETVNQNCSQLNKLNPIRLISFYFFYILGKIAIGYGIFQVIQAFRKFNIK